MASELALAIVGRVIESPNGGATRVDAELQAIREVLESFGNNVLSGSKGRCFGAFGSGCDDINHGERCQRVRDLMERMKIQ